jgi:hypothetical protein
VIPQLLLAFLIGCDKVCRVGLSLLAPERRPVVPSGPTPNIAPSRQTSEESRPPFLHRLPTFLIFALVILLGILSTDASARIPDSRPHAGDLATRTVWLRTNSPASAVVLSEQAATDYLYGGRSTVTQPRSLATSDELDRFLGVFGVDFVLIGPALGWQDVYSPTYSRRTASLLPLLEELRADGRLTEVYASSGELITVYRVNR